MSAGDSPDGDADRAAAILLYAELIVEAQALGAALLDRDTDEAQFRAALIAGVARSRDLSGVATLASDVEQRLIEGRSRNHVGIGVGSAYERLSQALDQLLYDAMR